MMRKLAFSFVALLSGIAAYAQDCYDYTRSQGISYYNKGEYRIAKDQFSAAKACPDKPAGDDLDAWIGKCDAAIRQAEERRRQAAEEAARRERAEREARERRAREEQAHAATGYMVIRGIDFGAGNGSITSPYGSALTASEVQYLYPRIHYDGQIEGSKRITVQVKMFAPDGNLKTGKVSSSGYTYSQEITVYGGSDRYLTLSGWGNETGGSYVQGIHRFELWYDGRKLYATTFVLAGPAEATYLKVDNKTAVSSTYAAGGGTETYYVSTDGPSYEVRLLPSWCTVSERTATSFTIRWTANDSGSSRSDWFQVASGSSRVRVDVSQAAVGPSATIERVWVDHNCYSGGRKGMRIHVRFSTAHMKGKQGECNAYFYFASGNMLKDYNGYYRASNDQVCVGESFTPKYDASTFEDFTLFLPYDELHMSRGSSTLKFDVQIQYNGDALDTSDETSFTYSS